MAQHDDDAPGTGIQSPFVNTPTKPDLPGLNRPEALGRMPLLRRPVTLYDPHSNTFEVLATNDNGALIAGPWCAIPDRIEQLRLGRREGKQDHFFLVDVIDTEEVRSEGQDPWTRYRVRWNAFAGSHPGVTSDFAAEFLRINLDARRVRLTNADHPAAPAEPLPQPPRLRRSPAAADKVATTRRQMNAVSPRAGASPVPASRVAPRQGSHTVSPSPTPTTPSGRSRGHANKRGKTPVSMRRPRTPMSIARGGVPGLAEALGEETRKKPPTTPDGAPGMGPATEEKLLKGRRPIPMGPGSE